MNIRRLNDEGVSAFGRFLDQVANDSSVEPPKTLLESADTSEQLPVDIDVESRTFKNRFEAAEYLYKLLAPHPLPGLERDVGLWAWLSLYFADQLFTMRKGKRIPGARARWILEPANWTRYYRHLLAGPYRIYSAHADNPACARIVLATPINSPGEAVEQIASRQDLITNPTFLTMATRLYYDENEGKLKAGTGSKIRGGARRLTDILNQFDLTWDVNNGQKT
jgi:hypothetical protein